MSALKKSIRDLVEETALASPPERKGTWFIQNGESLSDTVDKLTAAQASARPNDRVSSIAAHILHSSYYLELAIAALNGEERQGDWKGSWAVQEVDDQTWSAARDLLRVRVVEFLDRMDASDIEGDEDTLTYVLANLGHLAYHLGAIRQIALSLP